MKDMICKMKKRGFSDPVYYYVLFAAAFVFLFIAFCGYTREFYTTLLIFPVLLFLGAVHERRAILANKRYFVLPAAMVAWFLVLQAKITLDGMSTENIGLFLSVYLFAFPMAALLQDAEEKKALKIFATAYLAAAVMLTVDALLLLLDRVPAFLAQHISWDGARLEVFWHPNVAACFLMIGIVFCTTFFSQAKSRWRKTVFAVLFVMILGAMALTSCRTAIILTGAYLGALLFFALIKRGRKWFLPGVLVVLVLTVAVYTGTRYIYQLNQSALVEKYTQQSAEKEIPSDNADTAEDAEPVTESANPAEVANTADHTEPVVANANPNPSAAQLQTSSPQGTLQKDFGTLNSRTAIWSAAFAAIGETPKVLLRGTPNPGDFVSSYNSFNVAHTHNAWVECLLRFGLPGLIIAVLFTLLTTWNCLIVLLKYHQDVWKRNIALLALCLMAASVLEPYLFNTVVEYHPTDFLFFLCAGYLAHWQEDDNRRILAMGLRKIRQLKK